MKGTTSGTVTDFNGDFSVQLEDSPAVLVFSYTGFANQEVEVTDGTPSPLNIILEEDVTRLSEVVVTGLATNIKRSNLAK